MVQSTFISQQQQLKLSRKIIEDAKCYWKTQLSELLLKKIEFSDNVLFFSYSNLHSCES